MTGDGQIGAVESAPAPLRVVTKSEAVYRELRTRILKGIVLPGSTLNQETLAAEFGVSVTPLREALRRLNTEGLVQLEAHKTVTIAPLSKRELDEIYAVRLQLDPLAASLAAEHPSDEQLAEIERLASAPSPEDAARQLEANRAFHRSVYSASGNRVLTETLDHLWDRTDRYRLVLLQRGVYGFAAAKEHVEIAAALRSRGKRQVGRLMRTHLATAHELIAELADGL